MKSGHLNLLTQNGAKYSNIGCVEWHILPDSEQGKMFRVFWNFKTHSSKDANRTGNVKVCPSSSFAHFLN